VKYVAVMIMAAATRNRGHEVRASAVRPVGTTLLIPSLVRVVQHRDTTFSVMLRPDRLRHR
jgi:hypothetical protein